MSQLQRIVYYIDLANEWAGKSISFAFIPLVVIVTLEVSLRYVFNNPTIWAWDVNVQLGALLAAWGAGYTLLHGGHVKLEMVANRLHPKARAVLDLVTGLFFFLAIGILLWQSGVAARTALLMRETTGSIWGPPQYPVKILIVVGVFLFLAAGLSQFIRNLILIASPGRLAAPGKEAEKLKT